MTEGAQVGETYAPPSPVFGPIENADETRQAQHDRSNDSPTDVNNNAILARSQGLTVDIAGKAFQSNSDRRDKMVDAGVGIYKAG